MIKQPNLPFAINRHMKRPILFLLATALFMCYNFSFANEDTPPPVLKLSGVSNVTCGDVVNYSLAGNEDDLDIDWGTFGGTILSSSNFGIQVRWTGSGSGSISFQVSGSSGLPNNYTVNISGLSAPTTTGASGASGASLTLTSNENSRWYTSATGGSPFHTGTSYTGTFSTSTTYYVAKYNGYCESSSRTAVTAAITVGASSDYILNEATVYTVKHNNLTSLSQVLSNTDPEHVLKSTEYYDGLGRPVQSVANKLSPDEKDIVINTAYDQFGRVVEQYLPFKSSSANGSYKANYESERTVFYGTQYGSAETDYAFSETGFEPSPLGRTTSSLGPGQSWHTNNKKVTMNWYANTSSEQIIIWEANPIELASPKSIGIYPSNALTITETTDENGSKVLEYTDKLGNIVLKKVQESASNWLNTYYVYDDYGNLRSVIPPKAVGAFGSYALNKTFSSGVNYNLLFHYYYDNRDRMVSKKVPDAGAVYMVYNKRDELVLTQDANQRGKNEWTFTKYDELGRPVITGIYNSASSRYSLQNTVDANSDGQVSMLQAASSTVLGRNIYVSRHNSTTTLYDADESIEFLEGFDSGSSEFDAQIVGQNVSYDYVDGYLDSAFPPLNSNTTILSITYYDSYEFTGKNFTTAYNSSLTGGAFSQTPSASTNAKGLVTGSRTRVLGTDNWLEAVNFYDAYGKLIQTRSTNHKGGEDIETIQYDFSGKVLSSYSHHKNPEANSYSELRVLKRLSYDHADRLTKVESRNVGVESSFTVLSQNVYDALGQLATKQLGNGHQTLNYDYNIRGWLKELNDVASIGSDYFAMELNYASAGHYNGNIGSSRWRSSGNTDLKKYTYSYDKSNRIKSAIYTNQTSSARNGEFNVDNIGYDANGNISSLRRYGRVLNAAQIIDNLAYTYTANSNRLSKVDDSEGNAGIGDFTDGNTGTDYSYDANGNMTADANKDITAISYNRLNLPEQITFTGGRSINFLYDAAGIKLQKTVNDNGDIKTTDYIGGFIYQGNKLQHYAHEEGRVRQNDQGNLVYDYYIKDHLGNTRVTFTTEANTVNVYKATMESENDTDGNNIAAFEEQYFYNLDESRSSAVSAANQSTTGDDGCTTCNETAITNGQTQPIGPAIILDVMPGDEVDLEVWAYNQAGISSSTSRISSTALVSGLVNAFVPNGAGTELINQTTAEFNAVSGYLTGGGGTGSTTPFAFLNYIVFDSDFDRVSQGHQRVSSTIGAKHLLTLNNINITQKGYIYIWVSNESNHATQNTFFDDLRVIHTKGQILQEDHYYPFGLNINALSSTAPLSKPNNFKYNGKELQSEFSLGWYDYHARNYDPQIGRWFNVDPAADLMRRHSPYNYAFDNPVIFIDPDGMMPSTDPILRLGVSFLRGAYNRSRQIANNAGSYIRNTIDTGGQNIVQDAKETGAALKDAVSNPGRTARALVDAAVDHVEGNIDALKQGPEAFAEHLGEQAPDLALEVAGGKGLGVAVAGTKTALAAAKLLNKIPDGDGAKHIFSDKAGKFLDSKENRATITGLVNNSDNLLGTDKYGKQWYAQTLDDGTQIYGYTQDGVVKGAGVNAKPLEFQEDLGLKKSGPNSNN